VREAHGRGTQGREKVAFATFIWSLVVHALSSQGSLGHHLRTMSGKNLSDAAAQERREGLSWAWFEALFARLLRPLARCQSHPESFYHGMRLLGVDGSQWSLRNTAANTAAPRERHGNGHSASRAAFFKWGCAVLVELGTHQPLGAACAQVDGATEESEWSIARRLWSNIPDQEDTLLLADRYYGRGAFIAQVQAQAGPRCHLLVRVPGNLRSKVQQVLEDGSALVQVRVCHPHSQRTQHLLALREVRGQVQRLSQDQKATAGATEVRLWTTLLDPQQHPAQELLALYAQRWEQELFFRELKRHTGREQLLRAGSIQGAEAEWGAMIIAASLLAQQRLQAAQQVGLAPVRISLGKISRAMESLLPVLSVAGELISARQREQIITKFLAHTAREARIPPRRSRSCQRGLRKPACTWPRIHARSKLDGCWHYTVTKIPFP
jgi:DDE family transposase